MAVSAPRWITPPPYPAHPCGPKNLREAVWLCDRWVGKPWRTAWAPQELGLLSIQNGRVGTLLGFLPAQTMTFGQ